MVLACAPEWLVGSDITSRACPSTSILRREVSSSSAARFLPGLFLPLLSFGRTFWVLGTSPIRQAAVCPSSVCGLSSRPPGRDFGRSPFHFPLVDHAVVSESWARPRTRRRLSYVPVVSRRTPAARLGALALRGRRHATLSGERPPAPLPAHLRVVCLSHRWGLASVNSRKKPPLRSP